MFSVPRPLKSFDSRVGSNAFKGTLRLGIAVCSFVSFVAAESNRSGAMSTIWDAFVPKSKEVVPAGSGWLLNPGSGWLLNPAVLTCGSWHSAAFLCLTIACYLTVFRLVRWNRAARHRLEENLDRLVTMKQFSDLTDEHQRVRTQMNHQVHMYGMLDEEVDRLRDDAKTLLKTVVSAEHALLPERLRLRDLQYEQQQQKERQQQRQQKQPGGAPQQQAQQQPQQVRRRRPAPAQRPRQHQRPHATTSVPATASLPAAATHKEPATATATAPAPATSRTAATHKEPATATATAPASATSSTAATHKEPATATATAPAPATSSTAATHKEPATATATAPAPATSSTAATACDAGATTTA